MADDTNSETNARMHPVASRRLARLKLQSLAPSVTMAKWPNELGETPSDAIGKEVRLSAYGATRDYEIEAVGDDGKLWLRHTDA